jgi:hemolysin III
VNTFKRHPVDFGPMYVETLPGGFPVEPLNALSNIIFLVIAVYFIRKTKMDYRTFPFLTLAIPVLLVGFVGGTVFHATRSHWMWLVMDFLPIFVLGFAATYFFWKGVLNRPAYAGLAMVAGVVLTGVARKIFVVSKGLSIPLGYTLIAANILIPAALHSRKHLPKNGKLLLLAGLSFGVAVAFRQIDVVILMSGAKASWPYGTHFLWHVFGGISTYFVMAYVYEMEKKC